MRLLRFAAFFGLCLIHVSQSKPTANFLGESRGIGSSIWGWITYPFSWWSSAPEQSPVNDQLVGPSPYHPYDNVEIAKHNVTVWCNDQTCTTMKCDKFGCKNVTCNIYETDMRGECREYNTGLKPEEPQPQKPIEIVTEKVSTTIKPIETTTTASVPTQANIDTSTEERPLELEAVISSTVTESNLEKRSPEIKANKAPNTQNKIPITQPTKKEATSRTSSK